MIQRRQDCSILVVDDHVATRYALVRQLREAGYNTIESSAGASALELAPYASAVVLDVDLPEVIGHEVCRLLRANMSTSRIPVIEISAIADPVEAAQHAFRAGADGFMATPLEPAAMRARAVM